MWSRKGNTVVAFTLVAAVGSQVKRRTPESALRRDNLLITESRNFLKGSRL